MSAELPVEQAAVAAAARVREVLAFRLGDEEYGIDILRVQEIRSFERTTQIVGAPPFIRGVINLRGVIVPVADLRLKFGLADAACDGTTAVVVLSVGDRVVGVVVDAVSDVIALAASQIREAPAFNESVVVDHIDGLACIKQDEGERLVILLDIEALMRSTDMGLFNAA
jgi:purine-binding chemotaxis protein CheW